MSRSSSGRPANGSSSTEGNGGTISSDGRRIAFISRSTNLPGGSASVYESYVRNTATGRTQLVSTGSGGSPASGSTYSPAISANGRFVVFYGPGDGLPGADPSKEQVWIHDLATGKTRLVSKADDGSPADGYAEYPSVSASGRYVAFQAGTTNLPGADGSMVPLAYVRDMKKGKTILVSRTDDGTPVLGRTYGHSVSADGSKVVFGSPDAALPGGDGSTRHIYVRDLARNRTRLMDATASGDPGDGDAYDGSITDNGRFLAYDSYATNLPGGNGDDQVFLRRMKSGRTTLISKTSAGQVGQGNSYYPHASEDGRSVVFESYTTNLPGDSPDGEIYLRDVKAGKTVLLSRAANGDPANAYSEYSSISTDGKWVSFYSGATNLGGKAGVTNVFRTGPLR